MAIMIGFHPIDLSSILGCCIMVGAASVKLYDLDSLAVADLTVHLADRSGVIILGENPLTR